MESEVSTSTPPITACINVFQDVDALEACLKSLEGKVQSIVVVDGAYKGFPHEKPFSTDGTVELAEKHADVVVTCKEAWPNEIVKRNAYLPFVPNGEWWFRIDADERLVGRFPLQLEGLAYRIWLARTASPKLEYPILALYKKGESSRYYGAHHAVWWEKTLLIKTQDNLPLLKGVSILHDVNSRSRERAEAKGVYYRDALLDNEREFRERFLT